MEDFRAFEPQKPTYALIGWPLGHTMSPELHAQLFAASGQDADYIGIAVPPEDLEEAFALAKRKLCGINCTIPHKKAVIPLLDEIDTAARDLHSVNTVAFRDGKAVGYNTDILGFAESLKRDGVSLTEYLNGALIYALIQKQKSENPAAEKPVKLAMPVNLRNMFPSKTMRNFITMVYPSIDPMLGDYTFEEILNEIHYYMRYYINPKFLRADITTNYATRTNPLIRIVPLFVKDLVVRSFYIRVQDRQSSAGLTNMGRITLPPELDAHTERIDILMGQPFSARTNCAIVTFQNQLNISFASCIRETDVERLFFTRLVKDHIHVKIETNRRASLKEVVLCPTV